MEVVLPGKRQHTVVAGKIKTCCQNARNLVTLWERYDLEIKTCQVCGCKHRRLICEPMHMKVFQG